MRNSDIIKFLITDSLRYEEVISGGVIKMALKFWKCWPLFFFRHHDLKQAHISKSISSFPNMDRKANGKNKKKKLEKELRSIAWKYEHGDDATV